MLHTKINKLGIVGGNITAAFLCLEATKRGIHTILLEPNVNNTATQFAKDHMIAEITIESIKRLALRVDTVVLCTTQLPFNIEQVSFEVPIYPSKDGMKLVCDRIYQLTLAKRLDIPVPEFNYYEVAGGNLEALKRITLPFTFYEKGDNFCNIIDVMSQEEVPAFVENLSDEGKEWLAEQLHDYNTILSITLLKDEEGKLYTYPVTEENNNDIGIQINVPSKVSKTLAQKITRYAKKILKEVETSGTFTFEFGIKQSKDIELMDITPGIAISDITSIHYADLSVYEQFLNRIEGLPLKQPETLQDSVLYFTRESQKVCKLPYHRYIVDKQTKDAMAIYIQPCQKED